MCSVFIAEEGSALPRRAHWSRSPAQHTPQQHSGVTGGSSVGEVLAMNRFSCLVQRVSACGCRTGVFCFACISFENFDLL